MSDPLDTAVLEITVRILTERLDDLVGECIEGTVSKKSIMKARQALPSWCKNTLIKDKK